MYDLPFSHVIGVKLSRCHPTHGYFRMKATSDRRIYSITSRHYATETNILFLLLICNNIKENSTARHRILILDGYKKNNVYHYYCVRSTS